MNNHSTYPWHGTLKSYVIGLILSILLTFLAYFIVAKHLIESWKLTTTLLSLGILQMFAQLLFFLHLGARSKPRWNLLVFFFMVLFVGILVIGSLWIMFDLKFRVMPTMEVLETGIKK